VNQTVDACGQTDKHAEIGDGFDRAFDFVAALVVGSKLVPRISFALLHTKANTALVFVDLKNHNFDFVT
jgi:hypothetical protein